MMTNTTTPSRDAAPTPCDPTLLTDEELAAVGGGDISVRPFFAALAAAYSACSGMLIRIRMN